MLVAFWRELRRKPYRFLAAFPLLGQAVWWRSGLIDYLGLLPLHLAGLHLDDVARYIVPFSLLRWLLFPIPGFGGAQASLALSDYLYYRVYGQLLGVIPPTFITPLWLFSEWLIFYKALNKAHYYSAPVKQ